MNPLQLSPDPTTVGGAVALLLLIALTVIRLDVVERLRAAYADRKDRRRRANGLGKTVQKMNQQLDRIEAKQDIHGDQLDDLSREMAEMDEHVNQGFRTVALLHAGDPSVDNDVLRRRLGIRGLDDDLFHHGGFRGDPHDEGTDHHLDDPFGE